MIKPLLTAGVVLLASASVAQATPPPDASPQAHGRHVTVLPSCPIVPLPWKTKNAYVEIWDGNTIICAGLESGNHTGATMSFDTHTTEGAHS